MDRTLAPTVRGGYGEVGCGWLYVDGVDVGTTCLPRVVKPALAVGGDAGDALE